MRVFNIGIDCEEINRFDQKFLKKSNLIKIFTPAEIAYCKNKSSPNVHFAGKFAAKEAVIKGLSQAGCAIVLNEIEILNNNEGCPICHILNDIYFEYQIKISITHSKDVAIAVAVIIQSEV